MDVTEYLILLAQPDPARANCSSDITGALPDALDPLRLPDSPAPATQPVPLGVIRFTGQSDSKFSARLTLPEEGVFYATWPLAHTRARVTEWPDLILSAAPNRLVPLDSLKWLAPLRDADVPYVTSAGRSEKFLLYDAEIPFALPLSLRPVDGDDRQINIRNGSDQSLHDLVLYRHTPDGSWTIAHLDTVPPALRDAPPGRSGPTLTFETAGPDPGAFLKEQWTTRLQPWPLQRGDRDLITSVLKTYALDESQTTAVYRLDEAELDRILPLRITPQPAHVRRLALVIARNIDPDVPRMLDHLVGELGDRDWHKRESATQTLARLGLLAAPRLRQALQSADPEVVHRAERLLARLAAR